MDVQSYIHGVGRRARAASRSIAKADTATKNRALKAMAAAIERDAGRLLEANARDVAEAKQHNLESAMIDRLTLTPKGIAAMADGLRQMFLGTPIRSICIHPPWIKDISPLDAEWELNESRAKGGMVTNRDIVDAVIYAVTRPRHVTIASMIIDGDVKGTDYRSHQEP